MSRVPVDPHIVAVDDLLCRRAAAVTVAKAYLTAPQTWLFCITATVLAMTAIRLVDGPYVVWWLLPALASGYLALAVAIYAAANAVTVYITPRRATHRLAYVRTTAGAAALILRPDTRKGALPGDVQGACAGAWPKRRGAGRLLGEWVRELVHAEGGRVTLTATPLLAPTYKRHGLVEDGRTALILIRLASRARPTGTETTA